MVFDCEDASVHPEWDNLEEKLDPDHPHYLLKDNEVYYVTSLRVRSIQGQGNSFAEGRIEVGTKYWNYDNSGGDDTNQPEVGYSVTGKVKSVRCHLRYVLLGIK